MFQDHHNDFQIPIDEVMLGLPTEKSKVQPISNIFYLFIFFIYFFIFIFYFL